MATEYEYVRVGGPPENWTELIVLDLDKKEILSNVVEADAESGWAILIDPDDPQRRLLYQGRLLIVERTEDG